MFTIKEVLMQKSIGLIFLSISLAIIGQLFLKKGMGEVGRIGSGDFSYYQTVFIKTILNLKVLIGLLIYVLSAFLWLVVLSRVELSFAYPFVAIGYVLVMLISWFFLKESIPLNRWIGTALIFLGIMFISRT